MGIMGCEWTVCTPDSGGGGSMGVVDRKRGGIDVYIVRRRG